ncbi:hypothetical protein Misp01_29970 [Microtetraspora sp. NBRC 13810]|uniref:hypothetical protein n=1 Tax=Microtetraspora sp. NBRC 13810 TaxID=3030990 RepID=UPI0024A38535|nr:hypothetical protein [Microtetraspora sp. NBRC 13810]GLW07867.1 hypothetical protein Misp01_29970 [Microtetraspora sp. NBRC 13810]
MSPGRLNFFLRNPAVSPQWFTTACVASALLLWWARTMRAAWSSGGGKFLTGELTRRDTLVQVEHGHGGGAGTRDSTGLRRVPWQAARSPRRFAKLLAMVAGR